MATRPHGPFPADLEAAILELKEERNAVVLAHYYQESEVQDLADFVGDSLALAQAMLYRCESLRLSVHRNLPVRYKQLFKFIKFIIHPIFFFTYYLRYK